jgi:hypothetical protein
MKQKSFIALYPLTNTSTVLIYEIEYGSLDRVLAGINKEEPKWYDITDEMTFYMGDDEDEDSLCIPLSECIRY